MQALHVETVLWAAASVGLRVSALILFAPFFNSQAISMQVKAAFTVALTALLYPVANLPPQAQTHWLELILGEFAIGMILGLTLQLIVEGALAAGQLIGIQAGYSLVTLLDPQTQADTPVLATMSQLITLLIFLQANVHHWLLRGIAASFSYLPPGTVGWHSQIGKALLQISGGIWLSSLQIAAPAVVVTMLVDLTMGFVAKAAPQLPVLFIGLPVKTVLSLVSLCGALSLWPNFFEYRFATAIATGEHLLHFAK